MLLSCLSATKRLGLVVKDNQYFLKGEQKSSARCQNTNQRQTQTKSKHKPKPVHSKNLSCPFVTAWNLCSCSMKWPWSRVPRESRSVLTLSCAWRHSTTRKGSIYLKIAPPPTLSTVWTQHNKKYIFCFLTLVGLLIIFTLWRGLETSTSLKIYGMGHYMLWYRYSFCFSHTVKLTTTTHLEFKWQQSCFSFCLFFGCTIPFLPWARITMSWTFLYLFRDCRSSSIFRS